LNKGVVQGTNTSSKKWVNEIVAGTTIKEDIRSKKSIEEVMRFYKKGRKI